jgi:hypothetical protein
VFGWEYFSFTFLLFFVVSQAFVTMKVICLDHCIEVVVCHVSSQLVEEAPVAYKLGGEGHNLFSHLQIFTIYSVLRVVDVYRWQMQYVDD